MDILDNVVMLDPPLPQDDEADNETDKATDNVTHLSTYNHVWTTIDSAFQDATRDALADYGEVTHEDLADAGRMTALVADVLSRTRAYIGLQNAVLGKGAKLSLPQRAIPWVYAMILMSTDDYRALLGVDGKTRTLVMRVRTGPDAGLVVPLDKDNARALNSTLMRIAPTLTAREREEVRLIMLDMADLVAETWDKDMVWCANGVYDYHVTDPDKRFTAYCLDDGKPNPDYYARYGDVIITRKLAVDYVKDAPLVTFHNEDGTDWNVVDGIRELFDDPTLMYFAWQILHFCARQYNGGASIFAINRTGQAGGGGGKDTFANLMIGLLGGPGRVYRTPLEKWERNDHELEGIIGKMGWISSESNAPTQPVDDCEAWKNCCRGQAISINAKYKAVTSYVFHGVMFQMSNDVPMFRERSKSVYRCAECLPFEKDFHKGVPRDYIRDDYALRKETLEYVLFHALTMFDNQALDSYTEDVRKYVEPIKMDMRATASKVWEYMDEIEPMLINWMEADKKIQLQSYPDARFRIPYRFLYDVFADSKVGWCQKMGYGHVLNAKNFLRELQVWTDAHKDKWRFIATKDKAFRINVLSNWNEILKEYPVYDWLNQRYRAGLPYDSILPTMGNLDKFGKPFNGGIEYIG